MCGRLKSPMPAYGASPGPSSSLWWALSASSPRWCVTAITKRRIMTKRLTRSRDDQMIAGVCSGFAHYIGADPTIIRLAVVALTLLGLGRMVVEDILWLLDVPPGD